MHALEDLGRELPVADFVGRAEVVDGAGGGAVEDGVEGVGGVGGVEVAFALLAAALEGEFLAVLEEHDEFGDDFCGRERAVSWGEVIPVE